MSSTIEQIVAGIDRDIETLNGEIATLEATLVALRGESPAGRARKATSGSRENLHTAAVRAAANTMERERRPRRRRAMVKEVPSEGRVSRRKAPGQRQEQALAEIRRNPGISTIRLAPIVGVQRLHAYGLVKRLEADGKIEGSHKDGWRPVTQLRMPPAEKKDES